MKRERTWTFKCQFLDVTPRYEHGTVQNLKRQLLTQNFSTLRVYNKENNQMKTKIS